jgi:hypothetical protein
MSLIQIDGGMTQSNTLLIVEQAAASSPHHDISHYMSHFLLCPEKENQQ